MYGYRQDNQMKIFESKRWRLLATAVSFFLFGSMAIVLSFGLIVALIFAPVKKSLKHHITRHIIMFSARFYIACLRCLGVLNVKFENMELANQPGTLIIANHPTLLDAVMMMSLMPRTNFIIKAAVANNPLLSIIVSMAGYIPNNETGIALVKKASLALQKGETLMIFPEGTRTDPSQSLKFKRSAANIAIHSNCIILPVLITCEPITLRKYEPWHSIPDQKPLFHLRALPPIRVSQCVDTTQPLGMQARELNGFLQNLFTQSFSDSSKYYDD
jgi:1-acyl-sn-glycerol-3-phosphate acyltransferase